MQIWVDIDNAPHVLVLGPIIRGLQQRGVLVQITARDYGQTLPLLSLHDLEHKPVGRHAGQNLLKKGIELGLRSASLLQFAAGNHFSVAVCHGSRGVILPARLLGVPLVVLMDYEHSFTYMFRKWARLILMPEVISDRKLEELGFDLKRVCKFPGLKEELYVTDFEPDSSSLESLGLDLSRPICVVRPPATQAHYHVPKSEELFWALLRHLCSVPEVQVVILPRVRTQGQEIAARLGNCEKLFVLGSVIHGPNLLWHADAVFGGGGTMNREGACLGVPVYTFFMGPIGAVDQYLIEKGLMFRLETASQVKRVSVQKRSEARTRPSRQKAEKLVKFIVARILEIGAISNPYQG